VSQVRESNFDSTYFFSSIKINPCMQVSLRPPLNLNVAELWTIAFW
jgi:hypothetical protein